MNHRQKILHLLRQAPDREISCELLAEHYLYHKAASRISELRAQGYDIQFIPGSTPMNGRYKMFFDKDFDHQSHG
jgi:biotin operon repressor